MKKYTSLFLSLLMLFICTTPALAQQNDPEPIAETRFVQNYDGDIIEVKTIDQSEVPDGVIPLEVDSIEEADQIIKALTSEAESVENSRMSTTTQVVYDPLDALIDWVQYGGELIGSSGYMRTELRVQYNTERVRQTSKITNAYPYTSSAGIPIFASYTQTSCNGYIVPNTQDKEYYASAVGQIDYYIIIKEVLNYLTIPIQLSGQVRLIND